MFTIEEQQLIRELLAFNRECQEDNLASGEIELEEHNDNIAVIDSILTKLS